jgi:hypothetical protein
MNSVSLQGGVELMFHDISRRATLAGFAMLFALGWKRSLAAGQEVSGFEDPFLGQTTQGDLILAPGRTAMAASLPEKLHFFGIVRKSNVLTAEADRDKVTMFMLFAAFDGGDCRLSLCNLQTLQRSASPTALQAREALTAVAQRVKERPDSIYAVQDVDKLPAGSCRHRLEA